MRTTQLLLIAILTLHAPSLFAQGGAAAAEALFQEGRALYEAGSYAEACPKLADSHRLDPATGTLLTLALCHEGQGKLASAWAEFTEVEGRAGREGRDDRVTVAKEHAAALKPRLSSLSVDVPPEVAATPGLEVRVDDLVLGVSSFGAALPIDGGEHKVEARAPGKTTWLGTVSVKNESDAARVAVPPLSDASAAQPNQEPAQIDLSPVEATPEPKQSGGWMSTAGLVTAGVGVVALGVGGYLALDAKGDYDEAKRGCGGPDNLDCPTPGPFEDVNSARSQGNVATVVMSIGGVALAGGAALWLLAPSSKKKPAKGSLRIERAGVGPRGVTVHGSF